MTGTEGRVLEILWEWGGVARLQTIARGLGVSLEYARLITRNLEEHAYLRISNGWYELRGKGKLEAAKAKRVEGKPTKIVTNLPLAAGGPHAKQRVVLRY